MGFGLSVKQVLREPKENKVGKKRVLGIVFASLLLATAGWADQVTVIGQNNPEIDLPAVQAAVNVPDRTVYLNGTFDFGDTGSVLICVPNITLEGVATGATIKRGYLPLRTYNGVLPSGAKNITIRNIHFEGWLSWAIYHMGVQAEDNFTLIEGNTFTNTRPVPPPVTTPPTPGSYGVHYCTGGGSAEIKNNTLINLTSLGVATHDLMLHPEDHLLIEGNEIIDCHYDAISVDLWDRNLVDFDNGPVIIRNNAISLATPLNYAIFGIDVGTWWSQGVSNAVVEGNAITGWAATAISTGFWGHNRKIINNDFSGVMTWQGTILVSAKDGLIAGNTFGPTDIEYATNMFGMPWLADAINLLSQDPFWLGVHPQPLPVTGNIIRDNDFRLTQLWGWGYDAAGNLATPGCVMLFSTVDLGWNDPWPSAEVTDNLVKETGRFPAGTGGPKQQVLEFPVYAHHNRIVGHAADEYAQLEASNPGIGLKLKEAGATLMQVQQKRQAFIKELMEEAEEH
jgi:hypothetical protein